MSPPPLLYESFRRANPSAIDAQFAVNLQRTRRNVLYQLEAQAGRPLGQAEAEMVSLKAVEVMLNMTRTLLSDSQHQAGQQLTTAAQAIRDAAKTVPPPTPEPEQPRPGYERRVQHRRPHAPPPPRRPRNSIRRGHTHVHVPHVHVPHLHLDCGRHGNRDAPPPYRRHRRARRDPSPEFEPLRGPTPHPLEGFLFQGVGAEPQPDEDQVMRDETPFDFGVAGPAHAALADLGIAGPAGPAPVHIEAAGPAGPALVDFAQPRSPVAGTPARTDVSVAGTETPRPRSPITEAAPEEFLGPRQRAGDEVGSDVKQSGHLSVIHIEGFAQRRERRKIEIEPQLCHHPERAQRVEDEGLPDHKLSAQWRGGRHRQDGTYSWHRGTLVRAVPVQFKDAQVRACQSNLRVQFHFCVDITGPDDELEPPETRLDGHRTEHTRGAGARQQGPRGGISDFLRVHARYRAISSVKAGRVSQRELSELCGEIGEDDILFAGG
ncbi:hypothetical protein AURDEDRAFT_127349 [Auricularia subglabra TFB-10046 SS5]|uniref:Uncharacterized protein n=1 Tax=Auricularia subglabra (strain TFB-10046 / SS5) TaxID=717982 RepID=J0WX08_AURST|nr:hypothetical protein AURDEDRAFT_127349 [Auricularia subglabra TFB-10046 SS5]